MKKPFKSTIKQKQLDMIDSLSLPRDFMLGASLVTMIGNMEVIIENYKGILDYTEEYILIQGKTSQIQVLGKKLSINYYTNEDMKITGRIQSVSYL
ncbi:MAG: YabP/YqfC family sporulation protein [Eubacteriales bacterium]